jgi:integrase
MPLTIRKKKGSPFWYARGTIQARQADGRIARVRHEESLRTKSKTEARERAADLDKHYYELAHGKVQTSGPTFAQASLTYLQTRGKDDRFLPKLLKFFGETPISQIDQGSLSQAAHTLYPNASASTHNRAVFAPVITILRLSGVRQNWKRPRHSKNAVAIPPDEWFDRVLPCCGPRLAALVVFLTLTGCRITEALEAIDNGNGTVTIPRTKTGNPVVLAVPALVRDYLGGGGSNVGKKLFPYGDRHNVYRALKRACEKAGVLVYDDEGKIVGGWFGTHALGRHAFATRLLKQGKSLKFVQEAGGWASIKMPAMHYAHLEKSEVQEEVSRLGQEWGKRFDKKKKKNNTTKR